MVCGQIVDVFKSVAHDKRDVLAWRKSLTHELLGPYV